MKKENVSELLEVLEKIRSEEYPDVPKELIEEIVRCQYEHQDDRNRARSETSIIIGKYIK